MSISPGMLPVVAAALDASDDMVAIFEVDQEAAGGLRFVDASEAFLRFSGYSRAHLCGHPLGMLVAPEALGALHIIEQAARGFASVRGEMLCAERDGRRNWLGYHLMPVPAAAAFQASPTSAERPYFVLIGRDITQRRAEADQTRMIQGLLAKSFMLAEAPLAIVKPDGNFLLTNRCFDKLSGHADGSFAGKSSLENVCPESRAALFAARQRQTVDGLPFGMDVAISGARGERIVVHLASAIVEGSERQRFRVVTLHPHAAETADEDPGPRDHTIRGRSVFINLDEIRTSLGDRWGTVAGRVLSIAEGMIRRRLEEGDRLSLNGERGFTIRFAHAEEAQTALRAAAIARDIRQHLIGRAEDTLGGASASANIESLATPEPAETQMRRRLDTIEAASRKAEQAATRPPRLKAIHLAGNGAQVGLHVRAALSAVPGGGTFHEATFEQDLAALKTVAEMPADRAAQMVCLDVGLDTFLSKRKTEAYLEGCTQIGALARPNIVLMLSPLPPGITVSLLQDMVRRLKPFFGGIGCHIVELTPPQVDLRLVPLSLVAFEVQETKTGDVLTFDRMRRLSALLQIHHTRLLALNIAGFAARQTLHEAGVAYITVDADRD